MNNPLKVAKDNPQASIDWDLAEKQFSDVLLEAKALKVKIAEHVKKTPELEKVDQYSTPDLPSRRVRKEINR